MSHPSGDKPHHSNDKVILALRPSISPPPLKRQRILHPLPSKTEIELQDTAAVEVGKVNIEDHLTYFSQQLSAARKSPASGPELSITDFRALFLRDQHDEGSHFVIHQHDHPIAGTHYDLRLQINELSSVSWAIMYGLPGNPNSRRLNRNATETRVHCLWNHLIETASPYTGSLLIWDTGEYEILPYGKPEEHTDDESGQSSCESPTHGKSSRLESEPNKLHKDFQKGKIRLRLHGARLPRNYTIALWLGPSKLPSNQHSNRASGARGRKRRRAPYTRKRPVDSDDGSTGKKGGNLDISGGHSDNEEDEEVRRNNAYSGSVNSIGSVHQRTWYLAMDRESSGFQKERGEDGPRWERRMDGDDLLGFEPFFVQGREVERSIVTGRLAGEVLADEGVSGYIPRGGWRPVLE